MLIITKFVVFAVTIMVIVKSPSTFPVANHLINVYCMYININMKSKAVDNEILNNELVT